MDMVIRFNVDDLSKAEIAEMVQKKSTMFLLHHLEERPCIVGCMNTSVENALNLAKAELEAIKIWGVEGRSPYLMEYALQRIVQELEKGE